MNIELIHALKIPGTTEDAVAVLEAMVVLFNGGFNPDDNAHEIIDARTGEKIFNEVQANYYEEIMVSVWDLLEDPHETAIEALKKHGYWDMDA